MMSLLLTTALLGASPCMPINDPWLTQPQPPMIHIDGIVENPFLAALDELDCSGCKTKLADNEEAHWPFINIDEDWVEDWGGSSLTAYFDYIIVDENDSLDGECEPESHPDPSACEQVQGCWPDFHIHIDLNKTYWIGLGSLNEFKEFGILDKDDTCEGEHQGSCFTDVEWDLHEYGDDVYHCDLKTSLRVNCGGIMSYELWFRVVWFPTNDTWTKIGDIYLGCNKCDEHDPQ